MAEPMQGQHQGATGTGPSSSQPGRVAASVTQLAVSSAAAPAADATVLPMEQYAVQLEEAEELVKYAADMGIEIDDEVRRSVFAGRLAATSGWTQEIAGSLLVALTTLSAKLKPVSGESLRKCVIGKEAAETIRTYRRWAIGLGAIIVPVSVLAYVASATCEAIRKDIDLANGLAVTLVRDIRPAPATASTEGSDNAATGNLQLHDQNEVKDLQLFASTIRDIHARAKRLSFLGPTPAHDQKLARFELPVPLVDFSGATKDAIKTYQNVRYFAQSTQEAVSTSFGAVASCVLPALYGLLGACAFLIRMFEGQIKARTFTGMDRPTAHFLIAGIGGLVVGLFGDFGAGHGSVLPPLALAFLVGYGVDVFFYFLDGLLQTFARAPTKATGDQAKP